MHFATDPSGPIPQSIPEWGPDLGLGYDSFCLTVLKGLAAGGQETGFDFVWRYWQDGQSPSDLARILPAYDGVIFLSPRDQHRPLVEMLADLGVPAVLAWARHSDPRYASVTCDNAGGIAQAVRHIAGLGRKRIGYMSGPRVVASFRERYQAYFDAMSGVGLEVDRRWVLEASAMDGLAERKAAVARALAPLDRPSALICCDDTGAVAAIEQAWEMGLRVPDDLAVTGFDDSEDALQIIPHLTTVRQPISDMASLAMYLAAYAIEGQQPSTGAWQVRLPTTLVIRESSGAAPSTGVPADASHSTEGPGSVRQELEWRMRQLAAMNQEMKELLHTASHDLHSPLITIQGFASTLERKHADRLDEEGRRCLLRIRRSAESMQELIASLLAISRAHTRPLELKRVLVRDLIQRALDDLHGAITARQARIRVKGRLPVLLADETALYQVFLNLIGNALKYMGSQPAPMISIGHQASPEEHEFSVQDNGIGIAPEHHEEVFHAFRRLGKAEVEGAGIGLATVKRIILRHGGRIWVDSEEGQGSAFRFTLPRRDLNYDGGYAGPSHSLRPSVASSV